MIQSSKKLEMDFATPVEMPPASRTDDRFNPDLVLTRVRLLWKERRFLSRATGIGIVGSILLAFLIPAQYESTTRLMPPENPSTAGMAMLASLSGAKTGGGGGIGALAGDLLGLKSSGELFVGILQSRTVQDRLIERFDLRKVYREKLWEDARKKLASNTSISEDRKSGIIVVTVNDRDPQRATAMGDAYVAELNRLVAELSTSGARRERVFLEERLKGVQQDLEAAEKDFSQFASKNMAIDIKEQGKAMVEAAAMLQGQLIAAESQLEGLRQIYNDDNVRVRSVQAQVAALKQQMEKVGGKGDDTPTDSGSSKDGIYPSIKKLPLLGVTWADMYRRTKVQEAVFEVLTQQYELAKVQEAKETPSVKVLDSANIPERRSFPPRILIVVLGALLSLGVGMGWILGKAHWGEMDSENPFKVVALEVYSGARSQFAHASRNGSGLRWLLKRPALVENHSEGLSASEASELYPGKENDHRS
jgi:capsule polysaccharide export protein KpsE/RkpR